MAETKPTAKSETAAPSQNGHAHAKPPARLNPPDFDISLARKGGTGVLLASDQGPRTQELPGFDESYVDIVDYIIRITHRIWEQKDIGYIYDVYRHNSKVTDDAGLQYGRDKIVADTVHTINAFPDIRLFGDEVIWSRDEEGSYHTSHRVTLVGHNTGWSRWGPPTGKKIVVWCTANCVANQNEIFEEWVIYNNGAMLAQLGYDLKALARQVANEVPGEALVGPRFGEIDRLAGQGPPRHMPAAAGDKFDVDDFVRRTWHYTWNWRNLSTIDDAYSPTVRYHGATGRELYGRGALKSFVLSVLAMFPDLGMQVDDVYWMGNEREGYMVSVRWTALGTHRGHGIYGPPTNRQALLWGVSQLRIADGRIAEEWTVFNEFDVLQQLLREDPVPLLA